MGTLSNVLVVEDLTVLRFKPLFVRVKIELLQLFVIYISISVCVCVYLENQMHTKAQVINNDNVFNRRNCSLLYVLP